MKLILSIALAGLTASCALTTTPQSRKDAADLAALVKKYRVTQEERLDRIGKDYEQTYDALIKQNDAALFENVLLQADLDALRLSDKMIGSWDQQTLPSNFRDNIDASVRGEIDRFMQMDQAATRARQNYASEYSKITVKMAEIKAVEAAMQQLATATSDNKEVVALAEKLYKSFEAGLATNAVAKKPK